MGPALILYGSRARGESRPGSDVDLLLAKEGNSIDSPHHARGLSLHFYSKDWLKAEANLGSLFAYHVAFEGVALHGAEFLAELRASFRKKSSYHQDIEDATLIMRMLLEQDWRDNSEAKRRYFWALRTILISQSAECGMPRFSSKSLESFSEMEGLAHHIDTRANALYSQCALTGQIVLTRYGRDHEPALQGLPLRDHLIELGGIARDTVRVIEEPEAVEVGSGLTYL